ENDFVWSRNSLAQLFLLGIETLLFGCGCARRGRDLRFALGKPDDGVADLQADLVPRVLERGFHLVLLQTGFQIQGLPGAVANRDAHQEAIGVLGIIDSAYVAEGIDDSSRNSAAGQITKNTQSRL